MRSALAALLAVVLVAVGCSQETAPPDVYSARTGLLGEQLSVLGWNITLSNLRFAGEHVLVDVDASPADPAAPRAEPKDLRFGLYGALAHPIEADGLTSCRLVTDLRLQPLSAPDPDRLTGTVCLGPQRDQTPVRGVYVYSTRDRIKGTTRGMAAAFPVGLPPTRDDDTGLDLRTTSLDAFRADGVMLGPAALGDPDAFTGSGYMLIGLRIAGVAERYREVSAARGGPTMLVATPTLPVPGINPACDIYGSSVLILPEVSRELVLVEVTLCTQGEINTALLYPTLSLIGTHAALWKTVDD
ncbi:MAG: hypothetical protein DIU75_008095 [Mycolicibacterium hassiacum]